MNATKEKHYVSLDIGGTFIKHAAIDKSGRMLKSAKVPTPSHLSEFLVTIKEIIDAYMPDVRAVCVSCPGKIETQSGTIHFGGALPYLDGFSIKQYIEREFAVPSSVINDGKAAALAELWQGQLKGSVNGGVITLGTGVGGGLVVNGELLQGSQFQAGEISYMLLSTTPPFELSTVAGSRGSAVRFIEEASQLLKLPVSDGQAVFQALQKGEPAIYPRFEAFCRCIAIIITNVQTVVDLERIAIGGGISEQPLLIEEISRQYHLLRDQSLGVLDRLTPVTIVACDFRNEAGLLGALYQLLLQLDEH